MLRNLLTFFMGLGLGVIGCYAIVKKDCPPQQKPVSQNQEIQFSYGVDTAPIHIVEYSSSACSACSYFKVNTWPALKEKYIDTGKVYWVVKPFAFSQADLATAHISYCHDDPNHLMETFYKRQGEWLMAEDQIAAIKSIAQENGMPLEKIDACLQDQTIMNKLIMCRLTAATANIEATPTFILGKTHIPKAIDRQEFSKIIDAALNHTDQGNALAEFDYIDASAAATPEENRLPAVTAPIEPTNEAAEPIKKLSSPSPNE